MFKEAFTGIIVLFLFYLFCIFLLKKNNKALSKLIITATVIFCIANTVYNFLNIIPDYYMDIVNGRFRYGTFSGNLFAYSDEFMFQDEIIFPVLKNRSVSLDKNADFYEKFISLFAENYERIEIPEETRQTVVSHQNDFNFRHEFSCIGIMDYVTEGIPEELLPSFEEEIYPTLYINTDSLKNQSRLVILMEQDYSLYVMSEAYYRSIAGGKQHE